MTIAEITMPKKNVSIQAEKPVENTTAAGGIMVIVAHPDDEALMCGGTIAKHVKAGERVQVLILSEGVDSRQDATNTGRIARLNACSAASDILGCNGEVLNFPDQKLDTISRLDITKAIEVRIQQYRPHTVYTHWHGDLNLDHRIVSECALTACRPVPGCSVKRILMGEVLSSSEWSADKVFAPNWYVEVNGECVRLKGAALDSYSEEMREFPHARSKQASSYLLRWRGSCVGVYSAEAFVLVRNVC